MKSQTIFKTTVTALAAAALTISSLAFAQPRNDRADDRGGPQRGVPVYQKGGPGHDKAHGPKMKRGHAYGHGPGPGPAPAYVRGPGAGPDHNFYRGGRLPPQYRSRTYVVEDWRGHRLSAPPRGYQWVQTGGDYVMIAIATGVIAQILLSQ